MIRMLSLKKGNIDKQIWEIKQIILILKVAIFFQKVLQSFFAEDINGAEHADVLYIQVGEYIDALYSRFRIY